MSKLRGLCDECGYLRGYLKEAHLANGNVHDMRLLCWRCFAAAEAALDEQVEAEDCPHCNRQVVEETDHSSECVRRQITELTTGPRCSGAI